MADRFPPCRSLLFVPGDRPDRCDKAMVAGADAVCVDLEDAVGPAAKAGARDSVAAFLAKWAGPAATGADPGQGRAPPVIVRVNDPDSEEGQRDAAALTGAPRPDGFMIPKVTDAREIRSAQQLLGDNIPLLPIIETAAGLENAVHIGAASPAVAALMFGGFDLSAELGAEPKWEPLLYARSRVVHAAAMSGLDTIDMPSRDFRDLTRLRDEAEKAGRLGFTGKVAIHPAQIPVIHDVFTPSPEEVEQARRIVEADRAAGGGAVSLDGRMVDRPVVEAARRVLARSGARP
ncbi:MAG: CoA ester lyase [Gemmatimonadota bacterium]|nr:CoA ester lyase [Gemmatimonadota bacterium]